MSIKHSPQLHHIALREHACYPRLDSFRVMRKRASKPLSRILARCAAAHRPGLPCGGEPPPDTTPCKARPPGDNTCHRFAPLAHGICMFSIEEISEITDSLITKIRLNCCVSIFLQLTKDQLWSLLYTPHATNKEIFPGRPPSE